MAQGGLVCHYDTHSRGRQFHFADDYFFWSNDSGRIIFSNDRQGCQIDYMIQTKFRTCYLCEIKFNAQEITKSVIDEVKQKIKSLALPKNMSIRPVLIHVNGVEESVLESDFFSSIIDFNDLLHKH